MEDSKQGEETKEETSDTLLSKDVEIGTIDELSQLNINPKNEVDNVIENGTIENSTQLSSNQSTTVLSSDIINKIDPINDSDRRTRMGIKLPKIKKDQPQPEQDKSLTTVPAIPSDPILQQNDTVSEKEPLFRNKTSINEKFTFDETITDETNDPDSSAIMEDLEKSSSDQPAAQPIRTTETDLTDDNNIDHDQAGREAVGAPSGDTNSSSMMDQSMKMDIKDAIIGLSSTKNYIYTTASPCFNFDIFLEQFCQHVFYPLSAVYMYKKYGKTAIVNQTVWNPFAFIMVNMYLVILCLGWYYHKELKEKGVTTSEIIISLLAGTIFRLVVASKYASMTEAEYLRFLTCEDYSVAREMQTQMQLLTGWFHLDPSFCLHQAELAMSRMGFHDGVSPPQFEIRSRDLPCWRSILGVNSTVLHVKACSRCSNHVNVECEELMALIYSANNPTVSSGTIWCMEAAFAMCFSAIPGVVRLSCQSLSELIEEEDLCVSHSFLGDGSLASAMSVMLIFHTSFAIVPLTMFFIVTFLGNWRHFKVCRVYGLIVRADMKSPPTHVCPVLDLEIANNIRAWVRSRLALHFFGKDFDALVKSLFLPTHFDHLFSSTVLLGMRYYQRMEIYAKFCALILACLMVWLYVYSKQTVTTGEGANVLIVDVKYWVVCFLVVVWGGCFALTLAVLAATNVELRNHELEFLLHRLTVRERRHLVPRARSSSLSPSSSSTPTADPNVSNSTHPKASSPQPVSKRQMSWGQINQFVSMISSKVLPIDIKQEKQVQSEMPAEMPTPSQDETSGIPSSSEDDHRAEVQPIYQSELADLKNFLTALEVTGKDAVKKEELDDLMDTAVMIIEAQMRINPRRFLGADASWQLMVTYLGVWAAVIGFTLTVAGIDYST